MAAALDAGKHVSLAGPPGIGKSTGPEQYFINKGQPFVVVNGDAGFRRRDIEGATEIQNGSTYFKVAEFAAAAVNGWGCILNEVNAADPDALLFINGILEVPHMVNIHGRAYPVHPDFRLVVTYNPGLIGTKALPQAFKDRFFSIKLGFPNQDFLRRLIVAKTGVSENAPYLTRLIKYAEDCWTLHEKGTLRYQLSPRRLFDAVFLMEAGAAQNLDEAIRWAVIDAVDSASDIQALTELLTRPLTSIRLEAQFA
jgi:MoxR-like ATPase